MQLVPNKEFTLVLEIANTVYNDVSGTAWLLRPEWGDMCSLIAGAHPAQGMRSGTSSLPKQGRHNVPPFDTGTALPCERANITPLARL
jgi:hypothetical protein